MQGSFTVEKMRNPRKSRDNEDFDVRNRDRKRDKKNDHKADRARQHNAKREYNVED